MCVNQNHINTINNTKSFENFTKLKASTPLHLTGIGNIFSAKDSAHGVGNELINAQMREGYF